VLSNSGFLVKLPESYLSYLLVAVEPVGKLSGLSIISARRSSDREPTYQVTHRSTLLPSSSMTNGKPINGPPTPHQLISTVFRSTPSSKRSGPI